MSYFYNKGFNIIISCGFSRKYPFGFVYTSIDCANLLTNRANLLTNRVNLLANRVFFFTNRKMSCFMG